MSSHIAVGQRPARYPMTWLRAMGVGILAGAGCGIILAIPVAIMAPCLEPVLSAQTIGSVLATIGTWALGGAVCGLVACLAIQLLDLHMARLSVTKKRLLRSRRFWQTSVGILIIAACASLIPFWISLGDYRHDGLEAIGWPQFFLARGGGPAYGEYYDLHNLMIDLGLWMAIAILVASAARKGQSRLSVRMLLLLRNVLGANKRVRD
jgi:hypothetical protein